MKQSLNIVAAILFSLLFFNQSIGINLFIFSVLTIFFLTLWNPKKIKAKKNLILSIIYLITACFVFFQNSLFSILLNCAVFVSLIGSYSNSNTSIYILWLNGLYTIIAGIFHRNFEVNNNKEKIEINKDIDIIHLIQLIAIPLIFIIIFVLLYKNGNPVFNDLINKINFDFINVQWVLFTTLGYFLFNNISKPVTVEPATELDINMGNNLLRTQSIQKEKLKKEKQLGSTLLSTLNLVLILYIITDIISLSTIDYTRASVLSTEVHKGVNTLIASIIIAIMIILYFFRGNLNFYKSNRQLKLLTYLWIGLNIILIALIAFKNQNYITIFGYTYKRIGVHIYIFLTLIGLLTTLIKVLKIKNLIYLFRVNTTITFFTLIILSGFNWDNLITKHNLTKVQNFDINYLINLPDSNTILLYKMKDDININSKNKEQIKSKYERYIKRIHQSNWQELSFRDLKNIKL